MAKKSDKDRIWRAMDAALQNAIKLEQDEGERSLDLADARYVIFSDHHKALGGDVHSSQIKGKGLVLGEEVGQVDIMAAGGAGAEPLAVADDHVVGVALGSHCVRE